MLLVVPLPLKLLPLKLFRESTNDGTTNTSILKNLKDLDAKNPVQGLMRLARTYGPIFRLTLADRDMLVVSSQELTNELCDEKRFDDDFWANRINSESDARRSESRSAVDDLLRARANFDRLVAELGVQWPEGVNAVDAVRDVRREL